jgi:outer membrane protein OmpA-like peptidoglycan-associated protein
MAARFAEAEFKQAGELLTKAEGELTAGQYANATATAQLAREKADKAFALAKVQYDKTQEAAAARQRNEELLKEAAAIPGVRARREQAGELQKIVLPLAGLFRGRATKLAPNAQPVLEAVAGLMKKYGTYQVIIEGHTDRRGTKGALLALSQTRAAAVHEALLTMGVQARRMTVTGYGGERPVSDRRLDNNRIEIVFVLQ